MLQDDVIEELFLYLAVVHLPYRLAEVDVGNDAEVADPRNRGVGHAAANSLPWGNDLIPTNPKETRSVATDQSLDPAPSRHQRRGDWHLVPPTLRGHDPAAAHPPGVQRLRHCHGPALESGDEHSAWHHLCPMEWDRHRGDRSGWSLRVSTNDGSWATDRDRSDHRGSGAGEPQAVMTDISR